MRVPVPAVSVHVSDGLNGCQPAPARSAAFDTFISIDPVVLRSSEAASDTDTVVAVVWAVPSAITIEPVGAMTSGPPRMTGTAKAGCAGLPSASRTMALPWPVRPGTIDTVRMPPEPVSATSTSLPEAATALWDGTGVPSRSTRMPPTAVDGVSEAVSNTRCTEESLPVADTSRGPS